MITQEKIDRINELARKAKEGELTPEEIEERDALRQEYIVAFRENLRAQLEAIEFIDDAEEGIAEIEEVLEIDPDSFS